jgi:hypothetical protein
MILQAHASIASLVVALPIPGFAIDGLSSLFVLVVPVLLAFRQFVELLPDLPVSDQHLSP